MAAFRPSPKITPLSRRLIRRIFISASLIAFCMIALQSAVSFRHVEDEFEQAMHDIGHTQVALLSVSLWDIEPEAVRRQLQKLSERREVGYVHLKVATGQEFTAGSIQQRESAGSKRSFTIPPPQNPRGNIATLDVYANSWALYHEILYGVGTAFIGYGVLTLMICAMAAWMLNRELVDPLRQIAAFVKTLSPEKLTTPLAVAGRDPGRRDEIDLVIDGFGILQSSLNAHIHHLDQLVTQRTAELEKAMAEIRELSNTDPLTGCFNRRHFEERVAQDIERSERYGRPLSLIFIDIDHFKQINDSHGHLIGDQVLQAVAKLLLTEIRKDTDWAARLGGEEFIMVLPETSLKGASVFAARLRALIEVTPLLDDNEELRVTASLGVAEYRPGEPLAAAIDRADSAVYEAKRRGRNQVVVETDSSAASGYPKTANAPS